MPSPMPSNIGDYVYRLHPQAVIERFDTGALLFQANRQGLFELNPQALSIFDQLDGRRSITHIAHRTSHEFDITPGQAFADIAALYKSLFDQQFLILVGFYESQEGETMTEPRYIRNPDVGLREADEYGGLLFNPDTRQLKNINPTGLLIWQLCDGTRELNQITAALLEEFEGAPEEEVAADVRAFVEEMSQTGFIGTVERLSA